LPDNSIFITANMQWETGFPSSHQLKSYVASESPPEIGGARCPVSGCWPSCYSSPNLSGRRLDVYHTSTHGVALVRIQNECLKGAARGSLEMQDAKNRQKFAVWAASHNFVGLYLCN